MYKIATSTSVDKFELGRAKVLAEFGNAVKFKEDTFVKTGELVYELKEHIEFSKIPEFIYPIFTTVNKDIVCVMDSRKYFNAHGDEVNAIGYAAVKNLALVSLAFETNERDFMGVAPTLSLVYANWISGIVKQVYSLDTTQEESLKVLLSFYYTQRVLNKSSAGSVDYTAKYLTEAIKLPIEFIYDALESLNNNDDKTELDTLLTTFAATHELRNFKMTEDLIRELAIKSSWFGNNVIEVVGLAMDYPPSLLTMVATSVENNLYKRTKIGTVVDNLKRNRKLNFDLVRSLTHELVIDYGA